MKSKAVGLFWLVCVDHILSSWENETATIFEERDANPKLLYFPHVEFQGTWTWNYSLNWPLTWVKWTRSYQGVNSSAAVVGKVGIRRYKIDHIRRSLTGKLAQTIWNVSLFRIKHMRNCWKPWSRWPGMDIELSIKEILWLPVVQTSGTR